MERTKVVSSQIASIGYQAENKLLEVEFVGKAGAPGSVYLYHEIEPETHAELMAAESVGKYFNQHLRRRTFTRPEPEKAEGAA